MGLGGVWGNGASRGNWRPVSTHLLAAEGGHHPIFPRQSPGGMAPGALHEPAASVSPSPLFPQIAWFLGCLHIRVRHAQAS